VDDISFLWTLLATATDTIEDVVLGRYGVPKDLHAQHGPDVSSGRCLYGDVLAGDRGELERFILIVEGSIANEGLKRQDTGRASPQPACARFKDEKKTSLPGLRWFAWL
jgi:hypothetical protein